MKNKTVVSAVSMNSFYGQYLTVADLEKVTDFQGITRKEVGLTLEFYNGANEKILEVNFYSHNFYKHEVEKNQVYYVEIPGIGRRAAQAIPGTPYRITFLQGKFCVMVQTPLEGGKTVLNIDQMVDICKIISGRLLIEPIHLARFNNNNPELNTGAIRKFPVSTRKH
jgi:hypothetical protein